MCLYDDEGSIYNQGSGGGGGGGADIFVDSFIGYKTVQVGSLVWTAEDIKTYIPGFILGQPAHSDGTKNDRLNFYRWDKYAVTPAPDYVDGLFYSIEAMKYIDANCLKNGWRVPRLEDYQNLLSIKTVEELKSTSYWSNPGTNESGMDIKPCGQGATGGGFFGGGNYVSYWIYANDYNLHFIKLENNNTYAYGNSTLNYTNMFLMRLCKDAS